MFPLGRLLTNVKHKDKPEDRPGAVYKIKCLRPPGNSYLFQSRYITPEFKPFSYYLNFVSKGKFDEPKEANATLARSVSNTDTEIVTPLFEKNKRVYEKSISINIITTPQEFVTYI